MFMTPSVSTPCVEILNYPSNPMFIPQAYKHVKSVAESKRLYVEEMTPLAQKRFLHMSRKSDDWQHASRFYSLNRYQDILPYRWSQPEHDSYFNGNMVTVDRIPVILTQAPTPAAQKDFWAVAHSSRSALIIMVSKLTEASRVEAEIYFPTDPSVPLVFPGSGITVTLREAEQLQLGVERRIFTVEQGGVPHTIQHIWFSRWPDYGVPSDSRTIIQMVREALTVLQADQRVDAEHLDCGFTSASGPPMICHCSAGLGRSSTFAVCVGAAAELEREGYRDNGTPAWSQLSESIGTVVERLRLRRHPLAVQTEDQFAFIHRFIEDWVTTMYRSPKMVGDYM
eukprot:gnl/Dysnectes_brevis/3131_a3896_840.p1 GENE.gnl/Dysnectes_brevis/3131_a3896_840~~gnl/Dysnectes_brevis/3131_a3896_840.p1  ORF type:complete len:339 (-),score=90.96 gnl/Dysnectes_brevis/3131_a3896_840:47-1063(-)